MRLICVALGLSFAAPAMAGENSRHHHRSHCATAAGIQALPEVGDLMDKIHDSLGDRPLRSPFPPRIVDPRDPPSPPFEGCRTIPTQIVDVKGLHYYTDKQNSIVDPELLRKNNAMFKPLRDYVDTVQGLAVKYGQSTPVNPAIAGCMVDWLYKWADGGALLGEIDEQGRYEREWTLGSIALAFLKLKDAPGLDPGKVATIQKWLKSVSLRVQPFYDDVNGTGEAHRNNHSYWAGMAVAAAGVAANDRDLLAWGLKRYRMAMQQMRPDGTLPLEMGRGKRALHYHAFALQPLLMMAELGTANGVDLYSENGGAIHQLASKVLDGMSHPEVFEKSAGTRQEPVTPEISSWMAPYYYRTLDPRIEPYMRAPLCPFKDRKYGGNVTALWGEVCAP